MRFPAEDVGSVRPSDLSREARLACEFSPQILQGRLLSGTPCLSTALCAVVEADQWSWVWPSGPQPAWFGSGV